MTVTVNVERVQLLIDALNSDEFKQGRSKLEYVDSETGETKHCCLGVACRVAMRNGLELATSEYESAGKRITKFNDRGYGEISYLPGPVTEWYGFDNDNPELIFDTNRRGSATQFNDDLGYDFHQIADAFARTYVNTANSTDQGTEG